MNDVNLVNCFNLSVVSKQNESRRVDVATRDVTHVSVCVSRKLKRFGYFRKRRRPPTRDAVRSAVV